MTTYETLKNGILSDPASSNWLKQAVAKLELRDPCDALADTEILKYLTKVRLESLGIAHGVAASVRLADGCLPSPVPRISREV